MALNSYFHRISVWPIAQILNFWLAQPWISRLRNRYQPFICLVRWESCRPTRAIDTHHLTIIFLLEAWRPSIDYQGLLYAQRLSLLPQIYFLLLFYFQASLLMLHRCCLKLLWIIGQSTVLFCAFTLPAKLLIALRR